MKDTDKILKNSLKSEVDQDFTKDTLLYIRNRQMRFRILLSVMLLFLCALIIPYIPFESIVLNNLPYINKVVSVSKLYVFIAFTFTLVIFFDTLLRSILSSNQTKITTK
ncbi:MAG: hypothetical protein WC121_12495 [Candidatus Kapaibacterium sp.]